MKLIIVESPAKAKTIEKYLGGDYKVDASGGHIRDLPEKKIGVDLKKNFAPDYVVTPQKEETIKRLKREAKEAEVVYLATDPDREGEAISWHLATVLGIEPHEKCRIVFNEISKSAVTRAIQNPGTINLRLVDAQQARRVLDRLVGYKLSPVLCKKIQGKLSGGRVQSVALRLIADREREIQAFIPEEFWTLAASLEKPAAPPVFKAMLAEKDGKKIKPANKEQTDAVLAALEGASYRVSSVKKSVSRSHAPAPFTTSTMQQEASNKLGLSASATMMTAQQLYEGLDVKGEGHAALVTYIRTDSVRVSADAQREAAEFIRARFGADYVPATPNFYKSRKQSQDAHEAIRPISLSRTPESLRDKLQKNHYRLYKLIYERFVASQMSEATYNVMAVTVTAAGYGFKAAGKSPLFAGFTAVYEDYKKEGEGEDGEDDKAKLPDLAEGDTLKLRDLKAEQKFTKPPARYTDASLVKTLEEQGIGRPSTYAAIISTIQKRFYTEKVEKCLRPTELGLTVSDFLKKHFEKIVDVNFTAKLEDELDEIEENTIEWQDVVRDFYDPFILTVQKVLEESERVDVPYEESDVACEKCGAKMIIKAGRYGKYLACPRYPDCQNIKSLDKRTGEPLAPPEESDIPCEKCGRLMLVKSGRFGKYLACPGYPDCKSTKPINEVVGTCPKCGKDVAKRYSKKGKVFYGCTGYPACDYVSWDWPPKEKK